MRGKQLVVGLFSIFAAGATLTTTACSHNYEAGGQLAPENAIVIAVHNQNFLDMDVYAVSEGLATRLGTVTGNSSRSFVVDPSMAVSDFRIVATPIGGMGRASTGTISPSAGETVDFTIGSTLRNSTVFIK
jgi:hypothetical protein